MDVYSTPMSAVCTTVVDKGNVEKGSVEEEEETSACIIYFGFISMVEKVTRVERYIYSERSKVWPRRWSGRWDAWEAEAIDFPSHVRCCRSSFPKRPASVDTSDLLPHPTFAKFTYETDRSSNLRFRSASLDRRGPHFSPRSLTTKQLRDERKVYSRHVSPDDYFERNTEGGGSPRHEMANETTNG